MSDPSQNQKAVAALFAALVETLDEKIDGFTRSFLRHIDEKHTRLTDGNDGLEALALTKALLREDLDRAEPASVVYAKTWAPDDEQLPVSGKVQLPTLDDAVAFWSRLPKFDRENATIETAGGQRLSFAAISVLSKRHSERV